MTEKVVFDTNVWISGLLWRGEPYRCLLLARARFVQIVYCQSMAAELTTRLRESFNFSLSRIEQVMYELRSLGELVEIEGSLRASEDADDDKFIECAEVAGCKTVVSSDRHLLRLGRYHDVHILTPAEFLERFAPS